MIPAAMRTFTLAIVEARENTGVAGLHTDPFLPDFRFDDLLASADSWLSRHEGLVEQAAGKGARLILLTEDITHVGLAATFLDDPSIFRRVAERQADVVPRRLSALAARLGVHVAASYFAAEGNLVRNFAELFGPDGRSAGRYRKVHMPDYERWLATEGSAFPVFATDLGRVGMLICYDQNWPEAFASLALGGAEIVLHPSAATVRDYRMLCRSADHHVFYAAASPRGSMITSPMETIVARSTGKDPEIILGELDGSLVDYGDERYYDALYSGIRSHRWRELRHRRPETYGALVDRTPPVFADAGAPALAEAKEQVAAIYARHRASHLAAVRGAAEPYHWDYWRDGEPRPRQ